MQDSVSDQQARARKTTNQPHESARNEQSRLHGQHQRRFMSLSSRQCLEDSIEHGLPQGYCERSVSSADTAVPLLYGVVRLQRRTSVRSLPRDLKLGMTEKDCPVTPGHRRLPSASSNHSRPLPFLTPKLLSSAHRRGESDDSSLRNSSVDLLAMLKETEERERYKLMGFGGPIVPQRKSSCNALVLLSEPPEQRETLSLEPRNY